MVSFVEWTLTPKQQLMCQVLIGRNEKIFSEISTKKNVYVLLKSKSRH